jgi:hypothetical protein
MVLDSDCGTALSARGESICTRVLLGGLRVYFRFLIERVDD